MNMTERQQHNKLSAPKLVMHSLERPRIENFILPLTLISWK
jgi:hypothetical protein